MNDNLRRFLFANKFAITLVNKVIRLKNKKKYFLEVNKRSTMNILEDYFEISKDLVYYPYDLIADNNLYGISYAIKKYIKVPINKNLDVHFEHGIYLGNYISKDTLISFPKKIITFGEERKKHLSVVSEKKVIAIGPYILYAKSLLDDIEINKIKSEIGRILLVFPSHSVKDLDVEYNYTMFNNKILEEKVNYDTVLVCLFHLDAQNEKVVSNYQELGCTIVCAGHKYDQNFLSRLRSIIEMSDFTISNSIGTHISYCYALGKNHRIFNQNIYYEGKNLKEKNLRNTTQLKTFNLDKKKIEDVFTLPVQDQPKKLRETIVHNLFGLSSVVNSPNKLKKLLFF
jgi:hypothetical protein